MNRHVEKNGQARPTIWIDYEQAQMIDLEVPHVARVEALHEVFFDPATRCYYGVYLYQGAKKLRCETEAQSKRQPALADLLVLNYVTQDVAHTARNHIGRET